MAFDPTAGPIPRSFECQNCGARLPPPTAEGQQICQYCEAVYQVERHESKPQMFTIVFGQAPSAPGVHTATGAQAIDAMFNAGDKPKKSGAIVGLVIVLIILAAVGVPTYLAVKDGLPTFGKAATGSRSLGALSGSQGLDLSFVDGSTLVIPGERNASQEVVAMVRYYDQSS